MCKSLKISLLGGAFIFVIFLSLFAVFMLLAVFIFVGVVGVVYFIFRLSTEFSEEKADGKHYDSVEDQDIAHEPEVEHRGFRYTSLTLEVNHLHVHQYGYFKDEKDTDNGAIAESSFKPSEVQEGFECVDQVHGEDKPER